MKTKKRISSIEKAQTAMLIYNITLLSGNEAIDFIKQQGIGDRYDMEYIDAVNNGKVLCIAESKVKNSLFPNKVYSTTTSFHFFITQVLHPLLNS